MTLKPDLVAPGNQIISLDAINSTLDLAYGGTNKIPLSYYSTTTSTAYSDKYFRLSGTSMAAPVVSGAAALMLQANPNLTPDTIKARLMTSADKWTRQDGTADPCTYGAGFLNIPAALNCTITATSPAISPTLSTDANGNVYVDAQHALWGSRAIWGTGISDFRAIWGTTAIWGTNAIWGANILTASHAIWGSSVWSDRAIWGTSTSAVDLSSKTIHGE
jgi:serine protease AprX